MSQMKIAKTMPITVFKMIKAMLYKRVLRVMTKASLVWNRNWKFWNPIHGLSKIPFWKSTCLKAMTRPNIGM